MENSWIEKDNALERTFVFPDFKKAFGFLLQVAFLAEAHAHHPEITNVYRTVTLRLNTHDAGNIVTEKDRLLARAIDKLM